MSQKQSSVIMLQIQTCLLPSRDKAMNHRHHPFFKRLATIFSLFYNGYYTKRPAYVLALFLCISNLHDTPSVSPLPSRQILTLPRPRLLTQFYGITINPIGDTGFEPVTLSVLPVLRTTISTNLRELPSARFFSGI